MMSITPQDVFANPIIPETIRKPGRRILLFALQFADLLFHSLEHALLINLRQSASRLSPVFQRSATYVTVLVRGKAQSAPRAPPPLCSADVQLEAVDRQIRTIDYLLQVQRLLDRLKFQRDLLLPNA